VCVDIGLAVHPDQVVAQLEGGTVTGLITPCAARSREDGAWCRPISTISGCAHERRAADPVIGLEGGARPAIGEVGVPLVAPESPTRCSPDRKRPPHLPLEDGGVTFG